MSVDHRGGAEVTATDLGDLQDRTFARATPATRNTYPPERRLSAGQLASYLARRTYTAFDREWVRGWIRLRAERLLSYAAEGASP